MSDSDGPKEEDAYDSEGEEWIPNIRNVTNKESIISKEDEAREDERQMFEEVTTSHLRLRFYILSRPESGVSTSEGVEATHKSSYRRRYGYVIL